MDQDSDMTKFAYYGIATPEDEAEAETMEDDNLTTSEESQLAELEAVIERGLQTFVEVGNALMEIRDGRLYRAEYGTFEDYCQDRWGIERRHAYRLIDAAQVVNNVSHGTQILPTSERQARPLTSLTDEQQQVAWWEVVNTAPNGKVTSSHVQRTVDDLYGKDEHLDAALEDESKSVCPECGLVYDFPFCPECTPVFPEDAPTKMSQPMGVFMSHKAIEWYTPPEYIEAARQVMGAIDLDPATAPVPQAWIKATIFYTILDNGLIQPWQGRVWLNPPYSTTDGQSNQEIWSQKLIKEYESGQVTEAILLVKASLGYNWFDRLFDAYPVCFKRGLISFINSDRESGPAKLGSAFFYLGPNLARFVTVFGRFGRIVAPESVTYGY